MTGARSGVLVLAAVVFAGCYSHRSCVRMGQMPPVGKEPVAFPVRVTDVTFSSSGSSDDEGTMKRLLEAKRSNFVAECNRALGETRGEPADYMRIDVKLDSLERDWHGFNFLLYMCTFGVIPTQIDTDLSCELVLQRVDGGVVSRIPFKSIHNGTVSCFSPFALLRDYAPDSQAIREERSKTTFFAKTEGKYGMAELFVETMREGVGAILAEWQKAQKAAAPRREKQAVESPEQARRRTELKQLYDSGVISEAEYRREVERLGKSGGK